MLVAKISGYVQRNAWKQFYRMGMLTDKMTEKQSKKAEQEFKKEIEHMANKPTFTYLDYKQRINDELANLKSSISKKMSKDSKKMEEQLGMEKKIMSALYEPELIGETKVGQFIKEQISQVTAVPLEKVKQTFQKAESYKNMHRFLRHLNQTGHPLPDSMAELQSLFRRSRYTMSKTHKQHRRWKSEKGKGYMRAMRTRYIKFRRH